MKHTLGTAAKATGKSKGTIRNAITKGRLSASKNDKGEYEIDPAELHRVFEPVQSTPELNAVTPPDSPPAHQAETAALEAQIKLLREMLERANQNSDEWRKQAQTLALTHDKKPETKNGVLVRGWNALFGTKAA